MFRFVCFLVLALALTGCSKCGSSARPAPEVTGMQVSVTNAKGEPVLSRIAILQTQDANGYPRTVTEAWVQAVTSGTVVPLAPGNYTVRAQGTGDSFVEAQLEVKQGRLEPVRLGFATLILNAANLPEEGRARVWQKHGQGERIVVTQLVRPGKLVSIVLAAGEYRVGFLKAGLSDEDANFKPFGGEIQLDPGAERAVEVAH